MKSINWTKKNNNKLKSPRVASQNGVAWTKKYEINWPHHGIELGRLRFGGFARMALRPCSRHSFVLFFFSFQTDGLIAVSFSLSLLFLFFHSSDGTDFMITFFFSSALRSMSSESFLDSLNCFFFLKVSTSSYGCFFVFNRLESSLIRSSSVFTSVRMKPKSVFGFIFFFALSDPWRFVVFLVSVSRGESVATFAAVASFEGDARTTHTHAQQKKRVAFAKRHSFVCCLFVCLFVCLFFRWPTSDATPPRSVRRLRNSIATCWFFMDFYGPPSFTELYLVFFFVVVVVGVVVCCSASCVFFYFDNCFFLLNKSFRTRRATSDTPEIRCEKIGWKTKDALSFTRHTLSQDTQSIILL